MPASASRRIRVPSQSAVSVNEWPEPATLTVRPAEAAAAIAALSSSRFAGATISAGTHDWSPAQFTHPPPRSSPALTTPPPAPSPPSPSTASPLTLRQAGRRIGLQRPEGVGDGGQQQRRDR